MARRSSSSEGLSPGSTSSRDRRRAPDRMTWRGSLVGALLATLGRPRWWLLALAGFLVRGGVLVVLLPIVAPPTVAGLMSFLAPTVLGDVIASGPGAPVAVVAVGTAPLVTAFPPIVGRPRAGVDAGAAPGA